MKSKLLLITGLTLSINLITNAQVCFNSAVNYTVGATQPFAICTEDFNNDGKKDIAVSTDNSNVIAIFLGTGTGTFGAVSSFTAGGTNPKIICSDFNNDGNMDLASANGLFANNVSIYFGNGAGSFSPPTNFGVGSYPSALCSADLNADGKMDIAVTNVSSNDISILLGNGTGSFATAVNFSCGGLNPNSVVTADFNSDSKLDLVVANDASGNISLLLGNGTGSFGVATTYTIGTNPVSVFSKDFNSDGKADVVTANNASGNISVLLGTGTGSFNAPTNFAVINCQTVISEDFNGDGKLDLATAGGSASIMLGTGTGSFGTATTYTAGSGTNGVCSADFNGDGKLDLATANYNSNNISVLLNCNTVCSTPNITTGLVAKYDFTGNANDLSTNGNNGIVNGATLVTDRFGNANSAYYYDGINNYIEIPSISAYNNQLYTISYWTKFSSTSSSGSGGFNVNPALISKLSASASVTYDNWVFYEGNGTPAFAYGSAGYGGSSALFNNNNWHNIICTVNSDSVRFYYDGIQSSSVAKGANLIFNSQPIRIGRSIATYWKAFNGVIDDIRIYNRPLTDCDVDSLYNIPNPLATNVSEHNSNLNFSMYPNPANEKVSLEMNTNEKQNVTIEILDLMGKTIQKQVEPMTVGNNRLEINLPSLSAGLYLIKCNNSIQKIQITK